MATGGRNDDEQEKLQGQKSDSDSDDAALDDSRPVKTYSTKYRFRIESSGSDASPGGEYGYRVDLTKTGAIPKGTVPLFIGEPNNQLKIYLRVPHGTTQKSCVNEPVFISHTEAKRLSTTPVYYFTKDLGLAYMLDKMDYNEIQSRGYMLFFHPKTMMIDSHKIYADRNFSLGPKWTSVIGRTPEEKRILDINLGYMLVRKPYALNETILNKETSKRNKLRLIGAEKPTQSFRVPFGHGIPTFGREATKPHIVKGKTDQNQRILYLVPGRDEVVEISARRLNELIESTDIFKYYQHYGLMYMLQLLSDYGIDDNNERIWNTGLVYDNLAVQNQCIVTVNEKSEDGRRMLIFHKRNGETEIHDIGPDTPDTKAGIVGTPKTHRRQIFATPVVEECEPGPSSRLNTGEQQCGVYARVSRVGFKDSQLVNPEQEKPTVYQDERLRELEQQELIRGTRRGSDNQAMINNYLSRETKPIARAMSNYTKQADELRDYCNLRRATKMKHQAALDSEDCILAPGDRENIEQTIALLDNDYDEKSQQLASFTNNAFSDIKTQVCRLLQGLVDLEIRLAKRWEGGVESMNISHLQRLRNSIDPRTSWTINDYNELKKIVKECNQTIKEREKKYQEKYPTSQQDVDAHLDKERKTYLYKPVQEYLARCRLLLRVPFSS